MDIVGNVGSAYMHLYIYLYAPLLSSTGATPWYKAQNLEKSYNCSRNIFEKEENPFENYWISQVKLYGAGKALYCSLKYVEHIEVDR